MANKVLYQDPLYAQNPEDDHSTTSSLSYIIRRALMNMLDVCLPAEVVSYDRGSNRAVVKPQIQRVTVSNQLASRQPIYDVPVLCNGDGTFYMSFPVHPGTKGWIIVCDRDIEIYKNSLSESRPGTFRAHTFADSWFVPDKMGPLSVPDADSASFQNADGSIRVALTGGQIKIVAGSSSITVNKDGEVSIKATKMTVDAPDSEFKGNLTVQGATTMNGGLTANSGSGGGSSATINVPLNVTQPSTLASATISGREFMGHTHTSASPGSPTSGVN